MVLLPASDCCCNQDLNNLNVSSGGGSHRWAAKRSVEYLPCNETFKAPHDLGFTSAFFHAARCIGFCLLVPSQPHNNNAMEGGIGLAVASSIAPSDRKDDSFLFKSPGGLDGSEQCVVTARTSRLM